MKVEKYLVNKEPSFQPFQLVLIFEQEVEMRAFYNDIKQTCHAFEIRKELLDEAKRQGIKL